MRLQIGQFARLGQVSVSALRYYNDVGLLQPAHRDRWTGYRYYDLDQLPALNRILALKDLGLTLDEIRSLLGDELPAEQLRGMLRMKHAELQVQARDIEERLVRVEARIRQIELEGNMSEYDVVMKRVEPIRGAILHDKISGNGAGNLSYIYLVDEVADHMRKYGATNNAPVIDLWYDLPGNLPDEDMRITIVIPTANDFPSSDRVQIGELPAVEHMVSVIHKGPFSTISAANVAALTWIERNGYKVGGPGRGVYLQFDRDGDPNNNVTEIQFPVEKA